jgi:hypothetical protein
MIIEKERNRVRKVRLHEAAEEFAEKVEKYVSIVEVNLVGSLASEDPYPNDIDLALFVEDFNEFSSIAKSARQISSRYHGWEVFVFTTEQEYMGRICHHKKCPSKSFDCSTPKCGDIAHLKVDKDFRFDLHSFLISPYEVLFARGDKSLFEIWREHLNIRSTRMYEILKPAKKVCIECGRTFTFSVAEQKIYQKRGFSPPKRCERCRHLKNLG